jgi:hypothetical protein
VERNNVFWKRIEAEVDGFLFILKRKKGLPFSLLQSKNNLFEAKRKEVKKQNRNFQLNKRNTFETNLISLHFGGYK